MNEQERYRPLIEELAKRFTDPHQQGLVASQSGVPVESMPSLLEKPIVFWSEIVRGAEHGTLEGGPAAIAREATNYYPHNEVFRRFAPAATEPGAQAPKKPHDSSPAPASRYVAPRRALLLGGGTLFITAAVGASYLSLRKNDDEDSPSERPPTMPQDGVPTDVARARGSTGEARANGSTGEVRANGSTPKVQAGGSSGDAGADESTTEMREEEAEGDVPAQRIANQVELGEGPVRESPPKVEPIVTVPAPRGGVELIRIPPNSFTMGSSRGRAEERPPHEVKLDEFFLAKTPVTNEQYERFLTATPNAPKPRLWGEDGFDDPKKPVVAISWTEARAYCKWAGLLLPTEAQWEYACRAGTTSRYYTGNEEADLDRAGWYGNQYSPEGVGPAPVALKEPNTFGLYDMHGNVWEFTRDLWSRGYDGAGHRKGDGLRLGPGKVGLYVRRGGCYRSGAYLCRSASRANTNTRTRPETIGFRPAMLIEP